MDLYYDDIYKINFTLKQRKAIRRNIPVIFFMVVVIFNIFLIIIYPDLDPLNSLKFILYLNSIGFFILLGDKFNKDNKENKTEESYFDIESSEMCLTPISSILPRSTYP